MSDVLREIRLRLAAHPCTNVATKRRAWNKFVLATAMNRIDMNKLTLHCKHCGDRIWP